MSTAAVNSPVYTFTRARIAPPLQGAFDAPPWENAQTGLVSNFHPRGSDHRPVVRFKGLYDDAGIYVRFDVRDKFVLSKYTQYQDQVCRDSCVEFFVQPRQDQGYFNFEINCGGTLLLYYIEDPTRAPDAFFRKFKPLPAELGRQVEIKSSLPRRIDPEITAATDWQMTVAVPFSILESYTGSLTPVSGQTWEGNFFKCGDECSHPHWASWSPIEGVLRFHQPQFFGQFHFE